MAQQVRTLDFLPSIFKTETNQQFLAATLDVLTSQPDMKTVQGYIGNRHGYAISPTDKYVVEPTKERSDYQFDPAVTFQKKDTSVTTDFIDYPGIVRALRNQGWTAQDHNKLFTNKLYSWDSFIKVVEAGSMAAAARAAEGADHAVPAQHRSAAHHCHSAGGHALAGHAGRGRWPHDAG